jgi:murein DD-endopeptidase MepM/ murein hydrolase activator NlpD
MKNVAYYFAGILCLTGFAAANGESMLKAVSFPKVFNDAPFIARVQVLAEDYDDYESVYDDKGRCISGCAYPGITIEEETEALERNTRLANAVIQQYAPSENNIANNVVNNAPTSYVPTVNTNAGSSSGSVGSETTVPSQQPVAQNHPNTQTTILPVTYTCAQHRSANQTQVPSNSPIDVDIKITSDFGPRKSPTAGASSVHRGIDISVPTGTPVYATAHGTVEYIRDQGNTGGGKYIVIKHDNTDFRTAYFHLSNNQILKVGDRVQAGCLIGLSGNTGASTGPHLHYTIYYTQPGKAFSFALDPIDPLWTENQLKTKYRFKSQATKSCLHTAHNFCGKGTVPPDTLPGEIK